MEDTKNTEAFCGKTREVTRGRIPLPVCRKKNAAPAHDGQTRHFLWFFHDGRLPDGSRRTEDSIGNFNGEGIRIVGIRQQIGLQRPCTPTVFATESHLLVGNVHHAEVAGLEVAIVILVILLDGTAVDVLIEMGY